MAGNGNYPLNQSHYDEVTLQEYVLGQLLPDKEDAIRQHIAICPACRAELTDIQAFCRQLSFEIDHKLDKAQPHSPLNFDQISAEWRKPPRRVAWTFRLQHLVPSTTSLLMLSLFALACLLLFPSSDSAALRSLELTQDYHGPSAVIAAATKEGLVVLRLTSSGTSVVTYLSSVIDPRNLQFSPDGRWLALRDGMTLHVIETRKSGAHFRFAVNDAAEWSWSPDSQQIAYTNGGGQLAVFNIALQTNQILVPADEYAWGIPIWTADSQQIAYATAFPLPNTGESLRRQSIWRVNPTTGYRVEMANNPSQTLVVPTAWSSSESVLLAWDASAGPAGNETRLYRINVGAHGIEPIEDQSLSQGTHLVWPVNAQGVTLVMRHERLAALNLEEGTRQYILNAIPSPQMLEWAPNGAWMAYTVSGAAEGEGLYLFAIEEGELRPLHLPGGATEKAVSWAGAENLFVFRQRQDNSTTELWLVSLTTNQPPQRIMTNVRLPDANLHNGWQWNDVLATQVIPPEN